MMDSAQLECCINCDPVLRSHVIGVYAADRLPIHVFHGQIGLIVNTDIHSKPGRHWCAIYSDGQGQIDFFDSYGRSPEENSLHFTRWINRRAKTVFINRKRLQGDHSNVCGLYCLYYLRQRLLGHSTEDAVDTFSSDDFSLNDYYLYDVMTNVYSMCIENMCTYNQICQPLIKM